MSKMTEPTRICVYCGTEVQHTSYGTIAPHDCPLAVGDPVRIKATGEIGAIRFFLGTPVYAAYLVLDGHSGDTGRGDLDTGKRIEKLTDLERA